MLRKITQIFLLCASQLLANADIVSIQAKKEPKLSEHAVCAADAPQTKNEHALLSAKRHTCFVNTVAKSYILATDVVFVMSSVYGFALTRHPSVVNQLRKLYSNAKRIANLTRHTAAKKNQN